MKRLLLVVGVVLTIGILGTGFVRKGSAENAVHKKSCTGYVVIEVDKGIDCNGDTIRLVKKHGFFEVASAQD
ncbi:MAG TPA: hypothetical protein VKZ68_10605 [Ohtaekwangia sp.]|nr:hypothetical protein [Ohtaekwangia sp.]